MKREPIKRGGPVEAILAEIAPRLLREDREDEDRFSAQQERFAKMKDSCAAKPHGMRARYATGCRCMLCRAANSR